MKNIFFKNLAIIGTILLVASCESNSFKVKGNIEGGDGETLVVEKPDAGGVWIVMDSTKLSGNGDFSIKIPKGAGPEVYRLRLDKRYVYFPVDSTENIEVSTSFTNFGHIYELSGSHNAETLAKFEQEFAKYSASVAGNDSASNFKRHIFSTYLQPNPGSVVSYYILTKTMADGTPLYDVSNGEDYKYLAAVATAYKQFAPQDPHASMLENFAIAAMRSHNRNRGAATRIQAEEINLLPIALNDENGKQVSLSDVAGKGKRTLLVFAPLTDQDAPARNRKLLQYYNEGWNIFHVAFDQDQYAWREAAANLPWTTVNDPSPSPESVVSYNVTEMPAYFLIDASGALYDRKAKL